MRVLLLALLSLAAAVPAAAQQTDSVQPALTLDDALKLARRNNPIYQQTANDRGPADAAVRSAYAAFLPSADAAFQSSYREAGNQVFSGLNFRSSGTRGSSYNIGISYFLSTATFITPKLQRANRDAVEADITGAGEALRAGVIQQYLTVLQAEARADLQDTLVKSAAAQVELARARANVGSGTQLDVRRAEVALGEQQVAALQARNDIEIEKLRLFRELGVQQPANVKLVSRFAVSEPAMSLDELLSTARRYNPQVNALRSREKVAGLNMRRAQSDYMPSLRIATGFAGYTYENTNTNLLIDQSRLGIEQQRADCFRTEEVRRALGLPNSFDQCASIQFTPQMASTIRSGNRQYPFDFTSSPRSLTATLSLPLFDNFNRELRLQEASANRADARYRVRARELDLSANVTAAYLNLRTAAQTVTLQEQTTAKAREELAFTAERYRVGAVTFLDVTASRDAYGRAENARINAVYNYHKAFAALESAVGRPLR